MRFGECSVCTYAYAHKYTVIILRETKDMEENKTHRTTMRIVIIVLSVLLVLAICLIVWAVWFRKEKPTTVLSPDYAPVELEENAVPIGDSDSAKVENPEGGGGVGLEYTKDVKIDLSRGVAELYFANPSRSNQDMLVQLVIHDEVIIQSGRLTPGNAVEKLKLLDGLNVQLEEGVYEGKYVVYFYQQDTGEKAILNTEIPVTITVTK